MSPRRLSRLASSVLVMVSFAVLVTALPRGAAPPPNTPGAARVADTAAVRPQGDIGGTLAGSMPQQTFLVIVNHRAGECGLLMRAVAGEGDPILKRWYWGCRSGSNMAFVFTLAGSADEALSIVPDFARLEAQAIPVNTYSRADIEGMYPPATKP